MDFPISEDTNIVTNPVKLFTQELDLLFDTNKFEVLGNNDLGLNLQRYIGKFGLNANQIKREIITAINANCFSAELFNWSVDVSFFQRKGASDAVLIQVTINGYNQLSYIIK